MPRVSPEYEQAQKKRIMDGAASVFAQYGYRSTTIDQICQALQLSKGAIYGYFKSKEELFVSVLQAIYEQRFTVFSTSCHSEDPISIKFEKILDHLANLMCHDDYVFIRLSMEGFLESDHIPNLKTIKADSYQRFYGLLYGLLQEGQLAGEINADLNLASVTAVLIAVADGLMLHSLVQERGINPDRVRQIIHDTFHLALNNPSGNSRALGKEI
jgi:AcrR family transcriptional regulator